MGSKVGHWGVPYAYTIIAWICIMVCMLGLVSSVDVITPLILIAPIIIHSSINIKISIIIVTPIHFGISISVVIFNSFKASISVIISIIVIFTEILRVVLVGSAVVLLALPTLLLDDG